MSTGPAVPGRGDFDHLCVLGGFAPTADDAHRRLTYHGLVLETSSCYGTFRDARGTVYSARRGFGWDWARPLILHTGGSGTLRLDAPAAARSWSGSGLEDRVDAGGLEYRSPAGRPGAGMRLRRTAEALDWQEDGTLAVEGRLVGRGGLQWYDPSPPGAAHASAFFRVGGAILDQPVEGFVVHEQRYLPSGHLWADAPYLGEPAMQIAWTAFATEWDDGTIELGHLCAGHRSWGFAMVADATGPTLLSVNVEVEHRLTSLAFRSGAEAWEWSPDPSSPLEPLGPIEAHVSEEGLVRRVGDDRVPRTWMARLERPARAQEGQPT